VPVRDWLEGGVGSGAEVELDQWFVTTVREGKILRLQWFTDGVEAREAAGLSE
jgi:ketosteroid isomerase-like protein